MRIGISVNKVCHKDGTVKQFDGIGTYTLNLIKNLRSQPNIEVIPCYFNLSLKDFFSLPCRTNDKANIEQITGHPLLIQPCPFLHDLLPIINWHRNLEKQIDIFHSTDHLIPKLSDTPVIATFHDAMIFKNPEYSNSRLRSCKNYLLKKHLQYADHVITISDTVVDDLVNYCNLDKANISVIYNSINNEWQQAISNELQKSTLAKYQINQKFILSVGTLQPKKNLQRVLDAYQLLPKKIQNEFLLVIVGKAGWSCDDLVKNIKRLHEQGIVKWLDYVPFEDLRALYQNATSLIFPSLYEGFGLPIVEGFASKAPVITSNFPPMSEVAGDAAYLVDPYNVKEISHAVQTIIENPTLRNDLVRKGVERAKLFTEDIFIKQVVAEYHKLVELRRVKS